MEKILFESALGWMGLALCRFWAHYPSDSSANNFYNTAYNMVQYIHENHLRDSSYGGYPAYVGRNSWANNLAGQGPFWVSVEHHSNLSALAKCLQTKSGLSSGQSQLLSAFRTNVDNFINDNYNSTPGTGSFGTGIFGDSASNVWLNTDFIPADTQSWRYLADAGRTGSTNSKDLPSMNYLTSGNILTTDNGFTGVGTITGPKFTNNGSGVQVENLGSATLSLKRYRALNNSNAFDSQITAMENSILTLFNHHQVNGVPAHSEDESQNTAAQWCVPLGNCNTGIGWDYFEVPHTASVMFSIMALLELNPYGEYTYP
ncbi:MAG: hypothetical protein AB8G05_25305 [Oligoflexales bacterium]